MESNKFKCKQVPFIWNLIKQGRYMTNIYSIAKRKHAFLMWDKKFCMGLECVDFPRAEKYKIDFSFSQN